MTDRTPEDDLYRARFWRVAHIMLAGFWLAVAVGVWLFVKGEA